MDTFTPRQVFCVDGSTTLSRIAIPSGCNAFVIDAQDLDNAVHFDSGPSTVGVNVPAAGSSAKGGRVAAGTVQAFTYPLLPNITHLAVVLESGTGNIWVNFGVLS